MDYISSRVASVGYASPQRLPGFQPLNKSVLHRPQHSPGAALLQSRAPQCIVSSTVNDAQYTSYRHRVSHYRMHPYEAWYSCFCHRQTYLETPAGLEYLFCSLSMAFSGSPVQINPYNERTYSRQSTPILKINYFFPQWLLPRVVQFMLRLSCMQEPELILRVPRVVSDNAPVLFFAVQRNLDSIEDLFNQGLTSPFNVALSSGRTALHVSEKSLTEIKADYHAIVCR